MKNKLLTLAGALVLLVVMGRFYAQPLLAQVRAALVESIDEPGRQPYQQTVLFNQTDTTCNFGAFCDVQFNPVPAGFRLVITHASAFFGIAVGGAGQHVSLAIDDNSFGTTLLLPAPTFVGFNEYIASSPVSFFVDAGHTPYLLISGNQVRHDGSITAQATIVGHLVSVP